METVIKATTGCSEDYGVHIGAGLLSYTGELVKSLGLNGRAAIITDNNVQKLYSGVLFDSLNRAEVNASEFVIKAGESSKNINTLSSVLNFLAENKFSRSDFVIALGGGVVGDITGFAAGCYMRGIPYIQIPTTMLAAVDSSVGGKTAVDLPAGKNLAGLFYPPKAVICDVNCIKTLTPQTYADGIAEAVKTGVIGDCDLFSIFERGCVSEREVEIITRCVRYKAAVVASDEFEHGERKLLNLGHTAAHAVEKLSNYTVTHGHAVAMGIALIAKAAANTGRCSPCTAERIINVLSKHRLPTEMPFSPKELADAALSDKKRDGDYISIVIPKRIGRCILDRLPCTGLENLFIAGMNSAV